MYHWDLERETTSCIRCNLGKLLIGGGLRANFADLVGCELHKVRDRAVMQLYHQMQGMRS